MSRRLTATLVVACLLAAGCGADPRLPARSAAPTAAASSAPPTSSPARSSGPGCRSVVTAAGDIVNDVQVADQTGRVAAAQHPDQVLVLGDNQYRSGALADYRSQYDRTAWGSLKPLTKPVPGNHEYQTPGASGYYTYFDQPSPFYAYDIGCGWRGYALNSEIDLPGQVDWLTRDLAAHPDRPVLAYWHKPRWSSGVKHGSDPALQPFWDALAGRTGVVLNGHEHNYERFAPIGEVRPFVVGTGGTSRYTFSAPAPGSELRLAGTPGILRLELQPDAVYRWAFLDTTGAVRDQGSS